MSEYNSIVTKWLTSQHDFMDLVGQLIRANIVPTTLVDDDKLHHGGKFET